MNTRRATALNERKPWETRLEDCSRIPWLAYNGLMSPYYACRIIKISTKGKNNKACDQTFPGTCYDLLARISVVAS